MEYTPELLPGTLIKRYKRFLADIQKPSGEELTVHCPNTGAMLGCSDPGSPVWYSTSSNAKRKYPHTLEQVQNASGGRIGVNPNRANALIEEALEARQLTQLSSIIRWRREVSAPEENSRFDFGLFDGQENLQGYIEVKSVTLCDEKGTAAFPDAVSERALRHVNALQSVARNGFRAVLLFCVQHTQALRVTCASDIHPAYAEAVADAARAGVEVLAYGCTINARQLVVSDTLPVVL